MLGTVTLSCFEDWQEQMLKVTGNPGGQLALIKENRYGLKPWHTPNRSLTNQGRFLSVDPSGTINLHDPRTFNQYAYVAGNPLMLVDQGGCL